MAMVRAVCAASCVVLCLAVRQSEHEMLGVQDSFEGGRKKGPKGHKHWWDFPELGNRWPGMGKKALDKKASSPIANTATRKVGMANGGNTCFMATMLQLILHMPDFMTYITTDGNVPEAHRAQFGKFPLFFRDLAELYSRLKADFFSADTVAEIRLRLARDFGMPQESANSTEDSEIVLMKIIEAFGADTPGLSEQQFETKVADCTPGGGNHFVRDIPHGGNLPASSYLDWVTLAGTACGKVRVDPRNVAQLVPAEAAHGAESVTPQQALTSGSTSDTGDIEGVIDDVYADPSKWLRCNYQLQTLPGDEQFDPENPRNERFCGSDDRTFFPQDMVKVKIAGGAGGAKHLAMYQVSRSERHLIPHSPVLFLKVKRNDPVALAHSMGIDPVHDYEEFEDLKAGMPADPALELGPDGSIEVGTGLVAPFTPTTYYLRGCIVHHLEYNHWTSYVRVNDQWIHFDDNRATEVDAHTVLEYASTGSPLLAFELTEPPKMAQAGELGSPASSSRSGSFSSLGTMLTSKTATGHDPTSSPISARKPQNLSAAPLHDPTNNKPNNA